MLDRTHPLCIYCEEPVLPEEERVIPNMSISGEPAHRECVIRSALGSVAHAQRRCSCYIPGSTENDPEGMSKRNAARAAVEAHRLANFGNVLNIDKACPSCGCNEFNPGPRGGAARNIRCADCGAKYWYSPPFQPVHVFNADEVYNMSVRHTLPFPEGL